MRESRRIGLSWLLLSLLLLLLTACGQKTEIQSEDFVFMLNNTNEYARILRYKGAGEEAIIPESMGGKPVKEVAASTFAASPHVTSVSIPASVTKIEDPSFHALPKLSTITVAEGSVGFVVQDGVLYQKMMKTVYCYPQGKTSDSFTLPDTITTIGEYAFYNSQLNNIKMGSGVTKVYANAFAASAKLTNIELSPKLSQLYDRAFANCANLASVELPQSLTSIGAGCFAGCESLTTISVPPSVNVIKENAFENCARLATVDIQGTGVQRVAADTFSGCVNLTEVTFAGELIGIAERAFYGCVSLPRVSITDKLTVIGTDAFSGCAALTEVTLPEALTFIGARAFAGTAYLDAYENEYAVTDSGVLLAYSGSDTNIIVPDGVIVVSYINGGVISVTVPEGVAYIADGAFEGCDKLAEVNLPSTLTAIGARAFKGCSSLTSFNVPARVNAIGDGCFIGCSGIENFYVNPANTTFVSDKGVLYDNMRKYLIWYPASSTATSYVMPYGAKKITANALQGAKNLESFDASACEEMIELESYAFADCPKLASVKFTINFRKVGDYAFANCANLFDYDTTYTMTDIGVGAYMNCAKLKSLTLSQPLARIGERAFDGMGECVFTVSSSVVGEEYVKTYGLNYKEQ